MPVDEGSSLCAKFYCNNIRTERQSSPGRTEQYSKSITQVQVCLRFGKVNKCVFLYGIDCIKFVCDIWAVRFWRFEYIVLIYFYNSIQNTFLDIIQFYFYITRLYEIRKFEFILNV